MNQLDYVSKDVKETPTLHASAVKLLHNVSEEIHKVCGNPDATSQLGDLIKTRADYLARLMLAGTPVIEATPPVHPTPDLDEPAAGDEDHDDAGGKPSDE